MVSTVLENLKTARELLVDNGIAHKSLYRAGRYCTLGALLAARTGLRGEEVSGRAGEVYNRADDWPEVHALIAAIAPDLNEFDELEESTLSIVYQYSDYWAGPVGNRPQMVVDVFDHAIETLEAHRD